MLTSSINTRIHVLNEDCLHRLPHCLRRHYYRQRSAKSPPCITRDEHSTRPRQLSHGLPLPPSLDASIIDADRRLNSKLPKPRQDANSLTSFQKRLAANPYARALTTPVRQCSFTAAKLPAHFLLPFVTRFRQDMRPKDARHELAPYMTLHTEKECPGPRTSIVNSVSLLRRLGKKKAWHRLISRDMHDTFRIKDKKDWSWPENIEDIVLRHMRYSAVQKLKWAFTKPNTKLIIPVDEADPSHAENAHLLRLRPGNDLVVFPGKTRSTFDLTVLLGEDATAELTHGTKFANSYGVVLKDSALTTQMLVRLSRLQAYLYEAP